MKHRIRRRKQVQRQARREHIEIVKGPPTTFRTQSHADRTALYADDISREVARRRALTGYCC